jgi:hypothetical protein
VDRALLTRQLPEKQGRREISIAKPAAGQTRHIFIIQ